MAKSTPRKERKYPKLAAWLQDQPEEQKLRGVRQRLRQLVKDKEKRWTDLTWWHDVGICVARFAPINNRHYRDCVIQLLADDLQRNRGADNWKLPSLLYRARNFAAKYERLSDVKALERRRNADHKPLTPLHVSVLLTVKDDDQREAFLTQCLAESWSAQRLRREIQNATGRKGTGGRAPSPPKYTSAGVALRDIANMARRWTALHKVWFVGLRRLSVSDQNETMLREIEKARAGLKSVRDDAAKALKQVGALERQVKSELAAGATSRRAKSKKPA